MTFVCDGSCAGDELGDCSHPERYAMDRMRMNQSAGEAGKAEGMARAERGAGAPWQSATVEAIRQLAERVPYLTSDCLWSLGLTVPGESRALGPALKQAEKLGYIHPTEEFVLTMQAKRHRAPIRVWRSRLRPHVPFFPSDLVSRKHATKEHTSDSTRATRGADGATREGALPGGTEAAELQTGDNVHGGGGTSLQSRRDKPGETGAVRFGVWVRPANVFGYQPIPVWAKVLRGGEWHRVEHDRLEDAEKWAKLAGELAPPGWRFEAQPFPPGART